MMLTVRVVGDDENALINMLEQVANDIRLKKTHSGMSQNGNAAGAHWNFEDVPVHAPRNRQHTASAKADAATPEVARA